MAKENYVMLNEVKNLVAFNTLLAEVFRSVQHGRVVK